MSEVTGIEWTDATLNPIRARHTETGRTGWHCEKVSAGCDLCYAATFNQERLGTRLPYKPGHRKDIDLFLDQKMLLKHLQWKRPRMVFVCSMTDLFADFVPDEWIDKVFAMMAMAPQHTFQILTKRPKRMQAWVKDSFYPPTGVVLAAQSVALSSGRKDLMITLKWPLPNVWLGVSCEDQQAADERIPALLNTPAAVRFVSAEPLLSDIRFDRISYGKSPGTINGHPEIHTIEITINGLRGAPKTGIKGLDWIIVGGESGPSHRPMQMQWASDIIAQCQQAGTAVFVKQDSGPPPGMRGRFSDEHWALKQFPEVM